MKRLLTLAAATAALAMPSGTGATEVPNPEPRTVTRTVTTTTTDGVITTTTEVFDEPDAIASDEPKFTVSPIGRALFDGAVYISHDKDFVDGVAVPDLRAGVKMRYGMWRATIELGYAFNKMNIKDVFIQADFNKSMSLKVGYFINQFGLQSATGASMKISMVEPTSNEAFNYPRLLGAMYVYDIKPYFGTLSLHSEGDLSMKYHANDLGRTRFGLMTRQVWRPVTDGGRVVQVGVSAAYDNPKADNEFTLSANFPTRVSRVEALNAVLPETKHIYRLSPELLLNYGPLALESQYYWLHADRRGGREGYDAHGAYAMLRGLIIGGDYRYDHGVAALATPAPKSLEMVLGYNYTNLSDSKAGIRGGRINDVSATMNWYINKYIIWRLRYSYTHNWDREGINPIDLGTFQTCFQIIF